MSVENLKEYARRCAAEPDLRAKAKEIGLSDMDEHMRYADSLGLDWTMGDLADFRKEVIDSEGGLEDLSEQDLEQIAGGAVSVTAVMVGTAVAAGAGTAVAIGAGTAAAVGGAAAAGDGGW